MVTQQSPAAYLSPASSALSLPKLRENRRPRTRCSFAHTASMRFQVWSEEPSSTNNSSQGMAAPSKMRRIVSAATETISSSL